MSLDLKTIRENIKNPQKESNIQKCEDFDDLIEIIKRNIIVKVNNGDSSGAKTEIEVLEKLIKTNNLLKTEKPISFEDKQKMRDDLYNELMDRLERIAEAQDFENYEKLNSKT